MHKLNRFECLLDSKKMYLAFVPGLWEGASELRIAQVAGVSVLFTVGPQT